MLAELEHYAEDTTLSAVIDKFHQSNHEFRILYGSPNRDISVVCCDEIFRRCCLQKIGLDSLRRSKWLIVQNTFEGTENLPLQVWLELFPAVSKLGYWKNNNKTYHLRYNDISAEIVFFALDNHDSVCRLLCMEATGVWVNNCQELSEDLFENIIARVGRYPCVLDGGTKFSMVIADINTKKLSTYWQKILRHTPIEEGDPSTIVDCELFKA